MLKPDNLICEISDLLEGHYADPTHLRRWRRYLGKFERYGLNARTWTAADLNRGLSRLGLSHTRRYTPEEIEYYHLLDTYRELAGFRREVAQVLAGGVFYTGIGTTVQTDASGHFFVAGIMPRSPAEQAGLLVGDQLIAVNGQPYQPIISFQRLADRSTVLQVRRERNGPVFEHQLVPRRFRPSRLLAQATRYSARVLLAADTIKVGYVKGWSLAGQAQWASLTETISRELGDCVVLVLDLRGGVGGASPEFVDFFLGRSPELRLATPRFEGEVVINAHWRKPLVVLTDETTRSGSEVLAFALRNAGIPIVGERTAGAVAAAKPFILSDHSLLLVATRLVTVDGVVLEGKGVEPTVVVSRHIPYCGGEDQPFTEACRIAGLLAHAHRDAS